MCVALRSSEGVTASPWNSSELGCVLAAHRRADQCGASMVTALPGSGQLEREIRHSYRMAAPGGWDHPAGPRDAARVSQGRAGWDARKLGSEFPDGGTDQVLTE